MNSSFRATPTGAFDLPSLKDEELGEITQMAARQLVNTAPEDQGVTRFWGVLLIMLDEERQRRCREVTELERLFFGSAVPKP